MGLLTWAWTRLTRRLLGTEPIGTAGGFVVAPADADGRTIADTLDLPAYRDPVEELRALPDERGQIYLWTCSDASKADVLMDQFDSAGAQNLDAIHIVAADETELRELDAADLEPYIGEVDR